MATMPADRGQAGYALARDEGEAFWLLGMLQTIKIGRDDTAGQYGLVEIVVPAGLGSPWHVHPEEDEWFYVLEGELTVWVADTRLSLQTGSFAFGPKGVPHTFYAEAGGARALVGFAPMQFEGFQREVGQPARERVVPPPLEGPPDVARIAPIAQRNGFEILGPPGPPPGHESRHHEVQ
jgi:quercetin dioxygenase-like cupin family protein